MKPILKILKAAVLIGLWAGVAHASGNTDSKDLLIKFTDAQALLNFTTMVQSGGARIETLGDDSSWVRVQLTDKQLRKITLDEIRANPNVLAAQPNYKLKMATDFRLNAKDRARLAKILASHPDDFPFPIPGGGQPPADNPAIPAVGTGGGSGADPLFSKQWGMNDIGTNKSGTAKGDGVVVAVIDTGVDYTHEDLVQNLWRNKGEMGKDAQGRDMSSNGVDDDGNGFIDDVIGWDFVSNDNKPFDLAMGLIDILMNGGNPGHGTHCAGNVAGRGNNGKGITGVAPNAQIMSIRFLGEKGGGTTADAVKSINYAVKNGAQVMSNSWGSSGEDPNEAEDNKALRDAVVAAENAGVLFIAAAGNGDQMGKGYDNDSSKVPAYPASYDNDIIVSVAALDSADALGTFSNWGARSVDIGAPGVVVFSTTVGSTYNDTVFDMFGMKATWDGTSMATPHVAGAAALYLSAHPGADWKEVKNALMSTSKKVPSLSGKTTSGGKLSVENLMR
ncbi:MAG TPA: S8 family peptidase [Bdellovibrionales bacterium]|nr:S8 family peptidase [Bdellovibrionales bacterium]